MLPAFQTFGYRGVPFQAKNNIEVPLLALPLPKSQPEAITRVPQIVTYAVKETGMENKGELWYNHVISIGAAAVGERHIFR